MRKSRSYYFHTHIICYIPLRLFICGKPLLLLDMMIDHLFLFCVFFACIQTEAFTLTRLTRSNVILHATEKDIISDHSAEVKSKRRAKSAKWIACCSTKDVTRAIEMYIEEGDQVAELGSQLRESSTAICERVGPNGYAHLVDIERKFPNEKKGIQRTSAMRRLDDEKDFYSDRSTFTEMKNFDLWREALFLKNIGEIRRQYDALVVDVSIVVGNDLELTCISLIKEFLALNESSDNDENRCKVVIVKSGSLHDLARRLFHAQRLFDGHESIDYSFLRGSTAIIGTVGVEEYRRAIPFAVRPNDVCIEVGAHMGVTTNLIHRATLGSDVNEESGCIGIDIGPRIVKAARKKFPDVIFEVGDAWKVGELIRQRHKHFPNNTNDSIYDAVFVDVGGLSGENGLLEAISLISSISNSLEPRCIVIKSLCIRRLASNLVPFYDVWKKKHN